MFLILCSLLIAAEAAKLDNTYLPPSGAKESGGNDNDLQVPLEPPYIDQYTPQHGNRIRPNYRPATRGLGGKPVTSGLKDQPMLENEDEIVVPTPMLGQGRFISGSYSYTGPDNVLVTVTYKANQEKVPNKDEVSEEVASDDAASEEGETNYEEEEEDYDENTRVAQQDDKAEEEANGEDSVVPTPPSLPAELARAFDFHRRKQQKEEENTHQKPNKNKKPIQGFYGVNKKKGSQSANGHHHHHHQAINGHRQQPYGHHQASSGHHQAINGQHQVNSGHQQIGNDGNYGMKLNPSSGYNYTPQSNYVPVPPVINQGYSYAKHN